MFFCLSQAINLQVHYCVALRLALSKIVASLPCISLFYFAFRQDVAMPLSYLCHCNTWTEDPRGTKQPFPLCLPCSCNKAVFWVSKWFCIHCILLFFIVYLSTSSLCNFSKVPDYCYFVLCIDFVLQPCRVSVLYFSIEMMFGALCGDFDAANRGVDFFLFSLLVQTHLCIRQCSKINLQKKCKNVNAGIFSPPIIFCVRNVQVFLDIWNIKQK